MPLEVRLSAKAQRDQTAIWLYIAANNVAAADGIIDRFTDIFVLLADNPEAGRRRDDLGRGVRCYVVEGYVICYRIGAEMLDIVGIFHGARRITRRLLEK
jgi:toxin ParE1/3/4